MENLINNVSVWGAVLVIVTTLRVTWQGKLGDRTPVLSAPILRFFQRSYKPITVFFLSALALYLCRTVLPDAPVAAWTAIGGAGAVSVSISLFSRYEVARRLAVSGSASGNTNRIATILFDEKTTANAGALFLSLFSLLAALIWQMNSFAWNLFTVIGCMASFGMGGAIMLIGAKMHQEVLMAHVLNVSKTLSTYTTETISRDRFDALIGTLAAAMMLGTTFNGLEPFYAGALPGGAVVLPLVLAITGVLVSVVASIGMRLRNWESNAAVNLAEKMSSALLMIVAAYVSVRMLLPVSWVYGGVEYSSLQVFYAAQAGILGGMAASRIMHLYRLVQTAYTMSRARKSQKVNLVNRLGYTVAEGFLLILPVALIVLAILFSYQVVGLYGILIALVSMLANLSTKLPREVISQ